MLFSRGRTILGFLWIISTAILIILAWLVSRMYSDTAAGEIADWFLPHVLPTTGLVIATFMAQNKEKRRRVSRRSFFTALVLAVGYLIFLAVVLVSQGSQVDPSGVQLAELRGANRYLGAWQGLVDLAFGWFFVQAGESTRS